MVFHSFPRGCRHWMSQEHVEVYMDLPTTSYEYLHENTKKCRLEGETHNSMTRLGPVSYCLRLFHKLF